MSTRAIEDVAIYESNINVQLLVILLVKPGADPTAI